MAYNQVRMNIRNAMVGMSVAEARKFRDGWAATNQDRCVDYAEEFIRELEAEEEVCNGCS